MVKSLAKGEPKNKFQFYFIFNHIVTANKSVICFCFSEAKAIDTNNVKTTVPKKKSKSS